MTVQSPQSSRMFAEAAEAAAVVARQLEANADAVNKLARQLRATRPRGVVTYARGSSDHAATFAKYAIETQLGVLTCSAAPSIVSVYRSSPDVSGMLALAISQSGRSPDILAAMAAARTSGALTLALVNAEDSPLAEVCDVTLPLRAGEERSVAATKSYIASLAAILQLVAAWSENQPLAEALVSAPKHLDEAWRNDWSPLVDGLVGVRGLYVIGRGAGLGAAQEAALKFKETCGIHAEAFSAAELRHGPLALVGSDFPLLVLRQSDESGEGTDELVRNIVDRGAPVFIAGGNAVGAVPLPVPSAHPLIEPMLQIQALYRAANKLSLTRGLDPDRPPHLAKVTETL